MDTYYTIANFHIFIGSVLFLLISFPITLMPFFRHLPMINRLALWGLIASVPSMALSRVCPYPIAASVLLSGGATVAVPSLAIVVFGWPLFFYRNRTQVSTPAAPEEIDSWVVSFLAGRYLVLDPGGNILAGNLGSLEHMKEPDSTSFSRYVDSLARDFPGGSEQKQFFDHLRDLEDISGTLVSPEAHYHCRLSRMGDDTIDGYLFFVRDFTEEYQLLARRKEQERLAALRLERIREPQESKISAARAEAALKFTESLTSIARTDLAEIQALLTGISDHADPSAEDVESALQRCNQTMMSLRAAVHAMDIGVESP